MATIEFFTGFEGCENDADMITLFSGRYDYYGKYTFSSSGGYNDSKCLYAKNSMYSAKCWISLDMSPKKNVVVGWHIKNAGTYSGPYTGSNGYYLLRLIMSSGDNIHIFNESDYIKVYRGDTLIATASDNIGTGIQHLEIKVISDSTDGYVGIKLNGNFILDESDLDTNGNDIEQVRWGTSNSKTAYLDNLFIADDWIGALKTKLLQPTSDDLVQFTPSDGSDNYAMLQNNDGDDNYVYSDTVDHKDLYEYGPDIADDQYVKGVLVHQIARKDDTNARSLQTVMEVESTEYDLDEYVLPNEYPTAVGAGQYQVLGKAPDDTDWTYEKVNGMKVGFKVSA